MDTEWLDLVVNCGYGHLPASGLPACFYNRKNMKPFRINLTRAYRSILPVMALAILSGLVLCGCKSKYKILLDAGLTVPLTESQVVSLSVESKILGREIPCKVYLPKGYGGGKRYPVWYGLHGHGQSESMWIRDVDMDKVADEMIEAGEIQPIIMVFPFTRDATLKEIEEDLRDDGKLDERKWDQFLWKELVPYMDSRFDTVTSAEGRYIGGFSMGGAIALRIAFHHPELFSRVGGYTAAVPSDDFSGKQLEKWLYPNMDPEAVSDVARFAEEKGLVNLKVYLEAGNENDPFLNPLQSLHEALLERGVQSEFIIYNGGHSLDNARKCAKDYLRFYVAED